MIAMDRPMLNAHGDTLSAWKPTPTRTVTDADTDGQYARPRPDAGTDTTTGHAGTQARTPAGPQLGQGPPSPGHRPGYTHTHTEQGHHRRANPGTQAGTPKRPRTPRSWRGHRQGHHRDTNCDTSKAMAGKPGPRPGHRPVPSRGPEELQDVGPAPPIMHVTSSEHDFPVSRRIQRTHQGALTGRARLWPGCFLCQAS